MRFLFWDRLCSWLGVPESRLKPSHDIMRKLAYARYASRLEAAAVATGHASQLLVGDELPKPTAVTPLRGVFFWLWLVASVGTTIFWLPRSYTKEPESQSALVELLAVGCALVAVEGTFGIPSGMCDVLDGCRAHYFGCLGWEFLELGRIWQDLLLAGVGLWVLIPFRGVQNFLTWESM